MRIAPELVAIEDRDRHLWHAGEIAAMDRAGVGQKVEDQVAAEAEIGSVDMRHARLGSRGHGAQRVGRKDASQGGVQPIAVISRGMKCRVHSKSTSRGMEVSMERNLGHGHEGRMNGE